MKNTPYVRAAQAVLKKIYTESEEKPAKTAKAMRQFNAKNKQRDTKKYTKAEHSKGSGCNAYEILLWNRFENTPKYITIYRSRNFKRR